MRSALTLCFLLLLAPAMASAKDKGNAYERVLKSGTLRCGIMVWPPYFTLDQKTGEVGGLAKELGDGVARILDIKIDYVEIVIGQQAEDLKNGKVDAICNDGPYVFSAMKFVDYTTPLYYAPVYAYVRADEKRFKNADALKSKETRFIGMDGDLSVTLAKMQFSEAALQTLPGTASSSDLMMSVTTNKADAVIIDPPSADDFNKHNMPGLKALNKDSPLAIYPISFSVGKGETDLLTMLNYGVAALSNTGGIEPILKKYDPAGTSFYPVAKPYKDTP